MIFFKYVIFAFLAISVSNSIYAQTWNSPTSSSAVVIIHNNDEYDAQWSNWQWVDAKNNIHTFPGYCEIDTNYVNKRPYPTYSNLTNVLSNDGLYYINTSISGSCPGTVVGYVSSIPIVLTAPFQVLGVVYAPPGANGVSGYSSTTSIGSSLSCSNTFTTSISIQAQLGVNFIIADATGSTDWTFTTSNTNTNSTSVSTSSTISDGITGISDGINHDYDQIIVWLNPIIENVLIGKAGALAIAQTVYVDTNFAQYQNKVGGQSLPSDSLDIIYVQAGELINAIWLSSQPSGTKASAGPGIPMTAAHSSAFMRAWATYYYGDNESLAPTDFQTILARDLFNTSINSPSVSSINSQIGLDGQNPQNRFVYVTNLQYTPNNNPNYSDAWASSTLNSSNAVDTYSIKISDKAGENCILQANLTVSTTSTISQTVQTASNTSQTQTTSATIKGPAPSWSGGYSTINIYRDTLYDTYLYVPQYN